MGLETVININISLSAAPVSQASFGVPLILGPTQPTGWADTVHSYSSPAAMLTDGYTVNAPEYIEALALYSGQIAPISFLVGKRAAAGDIAQQDTFQALTVTQGTAYAFTINGTVCTYTAAVGDTDQQVLQALSTAATATGAVTGVITTQGSNKLLTLTGATPGQAVTYTAISSGLTHVATVVASGIAQDIANVRAENDNWYALITPQATSSDILQAAAIIETLVKVYFPLTDDTNVPNSASTTDLISKLEALNYKQTVPAYSGASVNYNKGLQSAWVGSKLPTIPGQANWNFQTLPGQTAEPLTDAQVATIIGTPTSGTQGKKGNVYRMLGGASIMGPGQCSSGDWVDNIIGKHWLQTQIQTNIYTILRNASAQGSKVPFTDSGAALIASGVQAAIKTGANNGLIDLAQGSSVTVQPVSAVTSTQRANRICPNINFSCVFAGAVNAVTVNGTVTD